MLKKTTTKNSPSHFLIGLLKIEMQRFDLVEGRKNAYIYLVKNFLIFTI